MHGFKNEQSAFTLLVRQIQHSLFATPCAQSATLSVAPASCWRFSPPHLATNHWPIDPNLPCTPRTQSPVGASLQGAQAQRQPCPSVRRFDRNHLLRSASSTRHTPAHRVFSLATNLLLSPPQNKNGGRSRHHSPLLPVSSFFFYFAFLFSPPSPPAHPPSPPSQNPSSPSTPSSPSQSQSTPPSPNS